MCSTFQFCALYFAKKCSSVAESLGEVMQVVLFNLTFTCVIVIALNLIVVELNESLNLEMVVAIADLITVLQLTFGHFFLAEWITTDLLSIGDVFYNSVWYRLPVKQQKLLVLPIERGQREFRLRGLGLFNCSLVVFSSVKFICKEKNTTLMFIQTGWSFFPCR